MDDSGRFFNVSLASKEVKQVFSDALDSVQQFVVDQLCAFFEPAVRRITLEHFVQQDFLVPFAHPFHTMTLYHFSSEARWPLFFSFVIREVYTECSLDNCLPLHTFPVRSVR